MAPSHSFTVVGRNGEEVQFTSGSASGSSTSSLLSLLPLGSQLRDGFRELLAHLLLQPQTLDLADRRRWQDHREQLARLIWNHTARPYQIRQDTSYEARLIGGKKVVLIGCKTREAKNEVKSILIGSGAMYLVHETLGFDEIHVDRNFKGHLAKVSTVSGLGYGSRDYHNHPVLGMSLEIEASGDGKGHASFTTVGGVILIDEKPYALATGCPFSADTKENHGGDLVVYSYSGDGRIWDPTRAQEVIRERNEDSRQTATTDWALVALPDDQIPPNSMASAEHMADWPWPKFPSCLELLLQKHMSEQDLAHCMNQEGGKVACLTFPRPPSHPRPGYIAAGTSCIVLNGTMYTVLTVDMLAPLGKAPSTAFPVIH
ncbi:hypothetical protein IL306_009910 [Fusarium sp. DS 682]|nr:hypothetical protein IL306_009910 [Fusarium sp. DS 682]